MIAPRASLNVVDSSAWLEYLAGTDAAEPFAPAIEAVGQLVVPSVCLLEVFKVVLRQRGESDALQAIALMQQGMVLDLDGPLALTAGRLGVEHRLALADSIVYATARLVGGQLWTQDAHFEGLPEVRFFKKP